MYKIQSIFNVSDIEETTLPQIVEDLKSAEMLGICQSVWNAENESDRKSAKRRLPAFTLCEFDGKVDSDHFISSEYLIFDVDKLKTQDETRAMKQIVEKFATLAFISPSRKGFKFAIAMDTPLTKINFRYNEKHWREYISAETGLELDKSYSSYHTFLSYDVDVFYNPDAVKFNTLDMVAVTSKEDIDPTTLDNEEIADVCDYLSRKKLNYRDWTMAAFALQNIDNGKDYFMKLKAGDTDPDHQHRDWEHKFEQCRNPKDITVASLYWIAANHGYKRKSVYIEDGKGQYNPFILRADGLYRKVGDNTLRIFGFRTIKQQYNIRDREGNKVSLIVDDNEIVVKATAFSSAGEFRKTLQNLLPGSPFMMTSTKSVIYYDMLFNYLDRTKQDLIVESLPGAGMVSNGIWNFGSVVYINGKVIPYDPLIIMGNRGYLLEDMRDTVSVHDTPALRNKLNLLCGIYKEAAATAIGWAVSNVYYRNILPECGGFPILFLYGRSSSGKSKLANIILAMFGVKSPETSMFRIMLSSGATATSMSRIKDHTVGIPQFFDEYGTSRDNKNREAHFQQLKGLFDGVGKTMARKTNDNQVHRMNIGSGSMFASVDKDSREEALNRCVYVDMNGLKGTTPEETSTFQSEFMSLAGLEELSAFALHIVYETTWSMWIKEFKRMRTHIGKEAVGIDNRIVSNWAVVAAGYNIMKKALANPVDDSWWVKQATLTGAYVDESDPVSHFVDYCYKFAVQGRFKEALDVILPGSSFGSDELKDGEYIIIIHLPIMFMEIKKEDRLLNDLMIMSKLDLFKRMAAHPTCYRSDSTYRFEGGGSKRCIMMRYTDEQHS